MYRSSAKSKWRRRAWFLFPLIVVAAAAIIGFSVMWLWNAILPNVTGWHPINYWQALGLFALCRILLGGARWGGPRHFGSGPAMRERWMNMSEEERLRMRETWAARCRNKG